MYRNLRPWLTCITDTPDGGTPPADPPKDDKPDVDDLLGDAGKKAIAAERRQAAAEKKRADELAARLKAFEDAQLSEQEKAAKRAAEAEDRASKAEKRAMRFEAAQKAGLDLSLAGRLQGETAEELEADAKSLLTLVGTKTAPKPDPSQGSRPAGKDTEVKAQVDTQLARLAPELKRT